MSSTTVDISPLAVAGAVVGGKYRLESMIGMGGMGSVWAASHVSLGQPFAVKIIAPALVKNQEAVRRFDVEAKAAVQIRSRHVPQVFDNGTLDDGTPYIVMERLHGEPLTRRIERVGTLPLAESVSVLAQCCRALTRAHSLGIVHRDIKPDNIYLAQSDDEDGFIAKVLDFGVAKITVTLESAIHVTRTGALIGTPAYMSPEQARALTSLDYRTDLYSLGLVAYAMLTGRQVFTASALGDMLLQICTYPLPSLIGSSPQALPPEMEAWFHKACAREPADRFQSAAEWSEALVAAAGISPSEVARAGKVQGSWSSLPPAANGPSASTGPNPVVSASSAPRVGPSTTGASTYSQLSTLPSRKHGAIVAGIAGALTVAAMVVTIALIARARSSPDESAVAAPPPPPTPLPALSASAPASDPPPAPSASAATEDALPDAAAPRATASAKPSVPPQDAREAPKPAPAKSAPPPPKATKSVANDNAVGY